MTDLELAPAPRPIRSWAGIWAGSLVLFMIVVTLMSTGLSAGVDRYAGSVVDTLRNPALTAIATAFTTLGSWPVVVILAIGFATVIAVRSRRVLTPLALLAAVASTSSLVYLLKIIIGRTRPPSALALGEPALDYSFPSGHTTSGTTVWVLGAVLLAGLLARPVARRLVVLTGIVVALLIGASRVYLGYHWLSDVVGGWLLALTLCAAAVMIIRFADTDGMGVAIRSGATVQPAQPGIAGRQGVRELRWSDSDQTGASPRSSRS